MPTELPVIPSELAQIVEAVFENMLGLEVKECGTPLFPGPDRLTATVHLAGAWRGAVHVEVDSRQACEFTGRFLSIDRPSSVDDVVREMLGELANMIGGNLKSVLARGIQLSMPSVVDGSDYSVRVIGAELLVRLAFDCSQGTFWVTIFAVRPEADALSAHGVPGEQVS